MFRRLILMFVFCTLLLCPASAHPGRTDSKGGHRDHSTGEYHYHHGFPAHQHTDGYCPYDYEDRTGQSSGSSGGSGLSSIRVPPDPPSIEPSPPEPKWWEIVLAVLIVSIPLYEFVPAVAVILNSGKTLVTMPFRMIRNAQQKRKERASFVALYGGRSLTECVDMPPDMEIGSDGLPKECGTDGWGAQYTFFISPRGKSYHCRRGCSSADIPVHACTLSASSRTPCQRCKPELPDLTWYNEYQKIKAIKARYNIE